MGQEKKNKKSDSLKDLKKKNSIRGKKSRRVGTRFEGRVREDLERMGWIVSRWMNTIDYDKEGKIGKLIPAKRKFNPFLKALTIGTGFPDFVCFKKMENGLYETIGVEVKKRGYLDKKEKGMCEWLIENKIFNKIFIAKMGKKRGGIEYIEFGKSI
ncbi:MAG: hypothetical protein QXU40_01710 [Candidatus Pacearchaeota archaeon]